MYKNKGIHLSEVFKKRGGGRGWKKSFAGFELIFERCIVKNYIKIYLVSSKGTPWLSLMDREFANFASYRLLENAISNVNLGIQRYLNKHT